MLFVRFGQRRAVLIVDGHESPQGGRDAGLLVRRDGILPDRQKVVRSVESRNSSKTLRHPLAGGDLVPRHELEPFPRPEVNAHTEQNAGSRDLQGDIPRPRNSQHQDHREENGNAELASKVEIHVGVEEHAGDVAQQNERQVDKERPPQRSADGAPRREHVVARQAAHSRDRLAPPMVDEHPEEEAGQECAKEFHRVETLRSFLSHRTIRCSV